MKPKLFSIISGSILLLSACSKQELPVQSPAQPDQSYTTVPALLSAAGIQPDATSRDIVMYVPGTYNWDCIPNVAPSCCYAKGQICYIIVIGGPVANAGNVKEENARIVLNTTEYIDGQITPAGKPPVFYGELENAVVDSSTQQLLSGIFHISR